MALKDLITVSRRYGKNPEYVLANGGNTSWKNDGTMYVKASGVSLAEIDKTGFVKMDRGKLDSIWDKEYGDAPDVREEQALSDLMDARLPGEGARPSVEALLHALFPQDYVVHLHPAVVNGMTCGQNGREAAEELFDAESVWVPVVNPGYILAKTVKDIIHEHTAGGKSFPSVVFLQNHGVFVAAESIRQIEKTYEKIISVLDEQITEHPDLSGIPSREEENDKEIEEWKNGIKSVLNKPECGFMVNRETARLVESVRDFGPISSAYTPDHIVYYGHKPLFVRKAEGGTEAAGAVSAALAEYRKEYPDNPPRIVAVEGLGIFAAGDSTERVRLMFDLFKDAVKISVYTRSFGGPLFMSKDKIDFIVNWEVEKYRSSMQGK